MYTWFDNIILDDNVANGICLEKSSRIRTCILSKFIGSGVPESRKRASKQVAGTIAEYAGSRSVPKKFHELVASVNTRFARIAPRIRRQRILTIQWVCTPPFLINLFVHCFSPVNIADKMRLDGVWAQIDYWIKWTKNTKGRRVESNKKI